MLLHAWQRMVALHGERAPHLVVIGQSGWEAENVEDLLQRSRRLQGHVTVLRQCTDAAAARLAAPCARAAVPVLRRGLRHAGGRGAGGRAAGDRERPAGAAPAGRRRGRVSRSDRHPRPGSTRSIDYAAPDSARRAAQLARIAALPGAAPGATISRASMPSSTSSASGFARRRACVGQARRALDRGRVTAAAAARSAAWWLSARKLSLARRFLPQHEVRALRECRDARARRGARAVGRRAAAAGRAAGPGGVAARRRLPALGRPGCRSGAAAVVGGRPQRRHLLRSRRGRAAWSGCSIEAEVDAGACGARGRPARGDRRRRAEQVQRRQRAGWQRPAGLRAGQAVVLVPGQVESDASIVRGCSAVRTNLALLQAVRADRPDAWIVYKPHPDVLAGLRSGSAADAALRALLRRDRHRLHRSHRCSMRSTRSM